MFDMNSSYHVLNRICQEVRQDMASKGKKDDEIEWAVNVEVLLFLAMIGHKPIGVNKHFMMLLIHKKFSSYLDHQISSKRIWDHLETFYDMAALHESEILPFPNEEVDFELPEECYDLLKSKHGVSLKRSNSESESTKNGSNSKSSKKIVTPKPKQSSLPVSSKIAFATPTLNKPLKSQTVVKSEIKTLPGEGTPKVKQELGSSLKTNKIKRSSSPLSHKTVKAEPNLGSKEDHPDISSTKKNKERGNSPATTKKPVKVESTSTNSSSKKLPKSETLLNMSKTAKEQTPDSVKKVKSEKDISKKGKTAVPNDNTPLSKKSSKVDSDTPLSKKSSKVDSDTPLSKKSSKGDNDTPLSKKGSKLDNDNTPHSKKSSKVDNENTPLSKKSSKVDSINGIKKKNESENAHKKTNETSSVKHIKSDAKSSTQTNKGHDVETPPPSGSRKSSPVVKVKSSDSSKKLKRPRPEEPSKKLTPGSKRRRIT